MSNPAQVENANDKISEISERKTDDLRIKT